jgi:hypothetical protein
MGHNILHPTAQKYNYANEGCVQPSFFSNHYFSPYSDISKQANYGVEMPYIYWSNAILNFCNQLHKLV